MNFSLHYRALQKKSLTPFLHDVETKTYLGIISVSTFLIMINLFLKMDLSLTTAFRRSLFQVVSIITTTGFSSDNFNLWPPFAKGIIFTLLFVGGCTGSTGGSIKVARYVILCKYAHRRIKQAINPRQIIQTKLGGVYIPDSVIHEALAFFFIYIILFVLGSLVLMATGEDVLTSLTASATSIGNVGPGLASIGPYENYSSLSALAKWTLSFLMLTGRLELITVLVLFYPGFWRK
jgi:trk system potassium uptake protein TrkH